MKLIIRVLTTKNHWKEKVIDRVRYGDDITISDPEGDMVEIRVERDDVFPKMKKKTN